MSAFDFLTKKQIDFIIKKCKVSEIELKNMTEETQIKIISEMVDLDADGDIIGYDNPDVSMATQILSSWSQQNVA